MKTKGGPLEKKGTLLKTKQNLYPELFMTRGAMWRINKDTMRTSVNPSVHLACLDLRK